jgi:hypothetical protein
VGRRRVDDDETLLVSQFGVGRSLVVSLGGTSAVVNGNDDRRLSSKLGRHIDVHASSTGVITEVLNLGELGRTTSERVARNGTQKGKDGSNERREMHLGIERESDDGRAKKVFCLGFTLRLYILDQNSFGFLSRCSYIACLL